MPKLTQTQQQERRERLLDAAERCFARSGFHAATMAEIARTARVSAGAAYIYFDSKEDLIAGIAARDRQRIATDFAAIGEAADFADALVRCARRYLVDEPAYKRQLMIELNAEATRNPVVARNWRSVDRVVQDSFRRALTEQVEARRIAPTMPLDDVVRLIMVVGDGVFARSATDSDFDAERTLAAIGTLIRQMLGAATCAEPATPTTYEPEGRSARRVA
jgi:TetR/AcrR family transcriptional repressor of uid operon